MALLAPVYLCPLTNGERSTKVVLLALLCWCPRLHSLSLALSTSSALCRCPHKSFKDFDWGAFIRNSVTLLHCTLSKRCVSTFLLPLPQYMPSRPLDFLVPRGAPIPRLWHQHRMDVLDVTCWAWVGNYFYTICLLVWPGWWFWFWTHAKCAAKGCTWW